MLEPYQNINSSRLIKAPKLYFLDTGLCAYLTGWTSPETLESGAMSGAILETYIVSELLKSYWHCAMEPPFFFYRDKDMVEIDLLIIQDGKIHPLEFKKTSRPSKDVIKNFSALNKLNYPIGHGGIICMVDKIFPLTQTVDAIPISYL
jgi:predicted AAA+ superfamily ATPase